MQAKVQPSQDKQATAATLKGAPPAPTVTFT